MVCSSNSSEKDLFRFKHFSVNQGNVAMRVNTDGVLLGAIAAQYLDNIPKDLDKEFSVLDIGGGTGVIALIMAQKLSEIYSNSCNYRVDAIDIEEECYRVAAENFKASAWSKNLHSIHSSLQDYNHDGYDFIVSNPPYFNNSLKNPLKEKSIARHTLALSYKELLSKGVCLMKDNGTFALIFPSSEKDSFLKIAHDNYLYETSLIYIFSNNSLINKGLDGAKRVVAIFSKGVQKECIEKKIFLEDKATGSRSEEYSTLTKDLYL